jgi:hypothetical protein
MPGRIEVQDALRAAADSRRSLAVHPPPHRIVA